MMPSEPNLTGTARLFLITGIMAAGKSTVAQALAERLPRSVHLRGDLFRRMIVNGRAEMGFRLTEETSKQLQLRYRVATSDATRYLEAGFSVVHQDIILGRALGEVAGYYAGLPLHVVVLCPRPEVAAARDRERTKQGYRGLSPFDFDNVLRRETPPLGL